MNINPNRFVQILNETSTRLSDDGLSKITDIQTKLNYVNNGKVMTATNMLDAFIAATGTVVEEYTAPKAINYFA